MSDLNSPLVGVAARDRASMRGTSAEDRVRELEARIERLERALAYQTQIPREIIIMDGTNYIPVPWSSDGRIYIHSSDGSIEITRSPHARIHVIDLTIDCEEVKACLLADTDWLDAVCSYCDTPTPPPPWPT